MIEAAFSNSTQRAVAPAPDDLGQAYNRLRLAEPRELEPREILTDLFIEELIPSPDLLADLVIARLGSRGFLIIERPKLPRRIGDAPSAPKAALRGGFCIVALATLRSPPAIPAAPRMLGRRSSAPGPREGYWPARAPEG